MTLVLLIDVVAVVTLSYIAFANRFEDALPPAAFLLILFPFESTFSLFGLFDLTTQRVIVVTLLALYFVRGRAARKTTVPMTYLIVMLVVWMLLSAVNSVVVVISLKSVLSQCLDFIAVYYIFAKSIRKKETIHSILLAFVAAMFVCSIFGFIEAYWDWNVISVFPPAPHHFSGLLLGKDRDARVQSSFGHAILFGSALAMTLPLLIYLVSNTRSNARKVCLWVVALLMFLNLYKTTSRGPWIAAVSALVLMFLVGDRRMRRAVLVICLLATVVLVARPGVWTSVTNLYSLTLNAESAQGQSYQWRYALYDIAFQHLNTDWRRALVGYGPESFFYLGWRGEFQGYFVPFESCDSSVAALMIETGYVGLFLVGLLLLKSVIIGYQYSRKTKRPDNLLCMALVTSILSFCFMMTNVAIFGWGQQSYMLWIILALTVTYPRLAECAAPAHAVLDTPRHLSQTYS
jgi:hypothetical protein